jgi:hypothetical protein
MGSSPYTYIVPYEVDFQRALDALRNREFENGRYNPVMPRLPGLIDERTAPGPGRQHTSIDDAREAAGADGTRSILDIEFVGDEGDIGIARRMTDEELEEYFETTTPTREEILENLSVHYIERGEAVCLPVYDEAGVPVGICFSGYSYD